MSEISFFPCFISLSWTARNQECYFLTSVFIGKYLGKLALFSHSCSLSLSLSLSVCVCVCVMGQIHGPMEPFLVPAIGITKAMCYPVNRSTRNERHPSSSRKDCCSCCWCWPPTTEVNCCCSRTSDIENSGHGESKRSETMSTSLRHIRHFGQLRPPGARGPILITKFQYWSPNWRHACRCKTYFQCFKHCDN